jgi:hypothetical protein
MDHPTPIETQQFLHGAPEAFFIEGRRDPDYCQSAITLTAFPRS